MFGFNHLLKEIKKMTKQLQDLTDSVLVLSANVQTLILLKAPAAEDLSVITAQIVALNDSIVAAIKAPPAAPAASSDTVIGTVIEHTNPPTV